MTNDNLIQKLDEVDVIIRTKLQSAKNGMRGLEESNYAKVRMLIQEAITSLHRINKY